MYHVEEINRIEALAAHADAWNRLLSDTPTGTFFHSLEWLATYWHHFGADQQLRVLLVKDGHQVATIVPLTVRCESTRAGQIRVLTYPLHDWGSFYGPIGRPHAACLAAAADYIARRPGDYDVLDLRWLSAAQVTATGSALRQAGLPMRTHVWKRLPVIELPLTWSEYEQRISGRLRANIRWCRNRLQRQGRMSYERYRPDAANDQDSDKYSGDTDRYFDDCLQVSRHSWQHTASDGSTLSHAALEAFFRQCHDLAARRGNLDVNLLYLNDQPIACCYNYHAQGYVFGLRTAFDQRFAKFSPGVVLQALQIEDSIRRQDRTIDLAEGYVRSKQRWMTGTWHSYRCTHYRLRSWKAQLLCAKHWLTNRRAGLPASERVAERLAKRSSDR